MIVVNGVEYRTLNDELMVNGRKVYEAYANGAKVYPEPLKYDARHYYLVTKGEGYLANRYDPGDERSPLAYVDATVTWIVRFRCESVSASGLGASIYGMQPLDDGNYFQVWTIIDVDAGGGGFYDKNEGDLIRRIEMTDATSKISGTYKMRRTDTGGGTYGAGTHILCSMGDLGYAGPEGPENNQLKWDLSELVGFAFRSINSSSNRDVWTSHYSDNSGNVSFSTLDLVVGIVYRISPISVRICYTGDNGRDVYEWVDPQTDFKTRYIERSYYTDGKRIAYSNDGKIIHRSGMISGDVPVKPWMFWVDLSPGPPKVRPYEMKLYKPGEELPDIVGDIDSIEEYDYRPAPS